MGVSSRLRRHTRPTSGSATSSCWPRPSGAGWRRTTGRRTWARAGFDRLVQLVRFAPALRRRARPTRWSSTYAPPMKVGGPGVLKALGTGRAGAAWLSYEYTGGPQPARGAGARTRGGLPAGARQRARDRPPGLPTLEKVHARTLGGGAPLVHGYLAPWSVMVSFDGAVRLRGFGLWAGRALGAMPDERGGNAGARAGGGPGRRAHRRLRPGRAVARVRCAARRFRAASTCAPLVAETIDAGGRRRCRPRWPRRIDARSLAPARRAPAGSGRAPPGAGGAALRGRRRAHHVQPRVLHGDAVPGHGRGGRARDRGGDAGGLPGVPAWRDAPSRHAGSRSRGSGRARMAGRADSSSTPPSPPGRVRPRRA